MKPGYRTSEFWFTLVSFLFSGLYLLGIIGDNAQKEDLIRDVSHGVESCILIGGQLFVLYKYVKGRTEIKKTYEKEIKHESQRTNQPRSSKTTGKSKRVSKKSTKNNNR